MNFLFPSSRVQIIPPKFRFCLSLVLQFPCLFQFATVCRNHFSPQPPAPLLPAVSFPLLFSTTKLGFVLCNYRVKALLTDAAMSLCSRRCLRAHGYTHCRNAVVCQYCSAGRVCSSFFPSFSSFCLSVTLFFLPLIYIFVIYFFFLFCCHFRPLTSTFRSFVYLFFLSAGHDSSVGRATSYGVDDPGIESRWGRDFPHSSRPALRPTQPPI